MLSYILDSKIENIRKVLKDEGIESRRMLACGDLKEIWSLKNNQQSEVSRVGGNSSTQKAASSGASGTKPADVYYQGVQGERYVDPE